MEYRFRCDVKPSDLWKASLRGTYHSFAGVVNLIFTISVIVMTITLWRMTGTLTHIMCLFACMLFPVIQPLAIYGRCVKQLEDADADVELTINDAGVCVTRGKEEERLPWSRIYNAVKRSDMIILMSDETQGYLLSNRTLGEQKEDFFRYVCYKLQNRGRMEKAE